MSKKEKKAHKGVLEKKKKVWNKELIENQRKEKTEKSFWKTINEGRKKRAQISKSITERQWKKHFKRQMDGKNRLGRKTREIKLGERRIEEEEMQEALGI